MATKEYNRKWRTEHPDYNKEYSLAHPRKKREDNKFGAEYQKIWRKNHPKNSYVYRKTYEIKHPEYIKKKRKKTMEKPKWKEYQKVYLRKYMRTYLKKDGERKKMKTRLESRRMYGKVPSGYERHHITYDNPHNFVLLTRKEHKEVHRRIKSQ